MVDSKMLMVGQRFKDYSIDNHWPSKELIKWPTKCLGKIFIVKSNDNTPPFKPMVNGSDR